MMTYIRNYNTGTETGWTANHLVDARVFASAEEAAAEAKRIRSTYPSFTVKTKQVGMKALGVYFVQHVVVVRSK